MLATDSRILDVGYGDGALLNALSASGYRDLTGIDPFVEPIEPPAPGVRVLSTHPRRGAGTYDIVMLHHSLEHLPDPAQRSAARATGARPRRLGTHPHAGRGQLWLADVPRALARPRAAAAPGDSEHRGHAPAGRPCRFHRRVDRVRLVRLLLRGERDLGLGSGRFPTRDDRGRSEQSRCAAPSAWTEFHRLAT